MKEKFDTWVILTIFGICGGISNWLSSDDDHSSFFGFFSIFFISGFIGLLVGLLCIEYGLPDRITFFVCGSAGLSAKPLMHIIRKLFLEKIISFIEAVTGIKGGKK